MTVSADATDEPDPPCSTVERVGTTATADSVARRALAAHQIIACSAFQPVTAGAGEQDVAAIAAKQRVLAAHPDQPVVTITA